MVTTNIQKKGLRYMKKKILYFITLSMMFISLTGCVKLNANLEINKDKSANLSVLYAIDTYLFNTQEILSDDDKKELEKNGFTLTDYSEGTYRGFNISKKIDNIDKVSTTNTNAEFDLANLTFDDESNKYLFAVKKGFFKNTYIANFRSSEDMDSITNTTQNNTTNSTTEQNTTESNSSQNNQITGNTDDLSKLSEMISSMDISFKVKLPSKAKNSNATKKSNNDKDLEWKLDSSNQALDSIKFEFDMYNMTNIYITVAIGAIILIILIIILIKVMKKNKNKNKNQPKVESPIPSLNNQNNQNINNSQIPPVNNQIPSIDNNNFTPPVENSNGYNMNSIPSEPIKENKASSIIPPISTPNINQNQPTSINSSPVNYNNQAIPNQTFIQPVSPINTPPTNEINTNATNNQVFIQPINPTQNVNSTPFQTPNEINPTVSNQPTSNEQNINRFIPPTQNNSNPNTPYQNTPNNQMTNNQNVQTNPNAASIFYQSPNQNNTPNNNPQ